MSIVEAPLNLGRHVGGGSVKKAGSVDLSTLICDGCSATVGVMLQLADMAESVDGSLRDLAWNELIEAIPSPGAGSR